MPAAIRIWTPDGDASDSRTDPTQTVQSVVSAYLDHLQARRDADDLSDSSLTSNTRELGRFAETFGNRTMPECKSADLTDFLLAQTGWKSNSTRRRVLAEILACFTWAASEAEIIPASPFKRPKRLRLPVQPRREATQTEYVALMRKGSRELRLALFFLRRSGARPCEMREADWSDVSWDEGVIRLYRHKTHRITGQARMIGLEPCLLRLLRNLHARAETKPIFTNCHGKRWTANALGLHLRRTLQRLGIDPGAGKRVTAYCLRHSWTTSAIEAGIGERQVADQLGQKGTQLVGYYSKAAGKAKHLRAVALAAMRRERAKDS